jgi:hypothetical protein
VAIPDDVDDPTLDKTSGVIELPIHIAWSEPSLTYDLNWRADRLRVYEQVLREGTEDVVRYYINVEELTRVFDELVLPPYVRAAWSEWFRRHARQGCRRSGNFSRPDLRERLAGLTPAAGVTSARGRSSVLRPRHRDRLR